MGPVFLHIVALLVRPTDVAWSRTRRLRTLFRRGGGRRPFCPGASFVVGRWLDVGSIRLLRHFVHKGCIFPRHGGTCEDIRHLAGFPQPWLGGEACERRLGDWPQRGGFARAIPPGQKKSCEPSKHNRRAPPEHPPE